MNKHPKEMAVLAETRPISLGDELVPIKNRPEAFQQRCWDNRDLIIRAIRLYEAKVYERRWVHKKRGTVYEIVGDGTAQCDRPIVDNDPLRCYQDPLDGHLYFRPISEFEDGRFEPVKYGD